MSQLEQILIGSEPSLSQGEHRHVRDVRKRKFCVPRFVAQYRY